MSKGEVVFLIEVLDYSAEHMQAAWRVTALAFGGPREPDPKWADEDWRGWVAALDGTVSGVARVLPFRQFFGGAAVRMSGVAGVAIDPHARGRGVASALLAAMLPAMREDGYPVSALYPAISPLYRRHGWEHAGVCEWLEVPFVALRSAEPPAEPVPLRPAVASDVPALRECYRAVASTVDGMLDRSTPPLDMSTLLDLDVVTVAGERGAEPRGYLAASRTGGEEYFDCYDLVARDVDAQRALLRSLASWAGQLATLRLRLIQPLALLPTDLGLRPRTKADQWMLRVVDLPAAVAARGWPAARALRPGAAADIEVVDEHAPWHAGRHRLTVLDDGAVVLEPGAGAGTVRFGARGLAAWYAGTASTAALRHAGLLTGPSGDDTAVLDALNGGGGALPRMANSF